MSRLVFAFASILAILFFPSVSSAQESQAPTSPVYAMWNGFHLLNIVELVNKEDEAMSVTLTLYDIGGEQVEEFNSTIAARSQTDIVLNGRSGFQSNSYGAIEIEFSGQLDGRISFYKTRAADNSRDAGDYEIAYSVPFRSALTGTSYVSFNTFQPSTAAVDGQNVVNNWLTLFNQDSSSSKTFTVNRYDQTGELLQTQEVEVGPLQRRDIDGGHGQGASVVGLNEIIPEDDSPYQAELVRFGTLSATGPEGSFAWAFPLVAQTGSSETQWAAISSGAGAQNWVELINAGSATAEVELTFYDNSGNELLDGTQTIELAARAQRHIDASAALAVGASGAAQIVVSSGSVAVNSMFYFRTSAGTVDTMYGSQGRTGSSGSISGSWNLFLDQFNWIRIFNTLDSTQEVTVSVENAGETTEQTLTLAARSGVDVGLHDTTTYGTSLDSFGLVTIEGQSLLTDLLRIRSATNSNGDSDYIFPTEMRRGTNNIAGIGTNLETVNSGATQIIFADAFKRSAEWVSVNFPIDGSWDTGVEVPMDDNGYPLEIPYSPDEGSDQAVATLFFNNMDGEYPTGTYSLIFEGTGTVQVFGDPGEFDFEDGGTYQVEVSETSNQGIFVQIIDSDAEDPIQNIRFVLPGYADTYQTQPFYQPFLDKLTDFPVVRYSQPMRTNDGRLPV